MPIIGLPAHLANTINLILDPDGKGFIDPKDWARYERDQELLVAFSQYVYRCPAFTDKSWGMVITYLHDSTESIETKLRAMVAHASTVQARPGSVDQLVAKLAQGYLNMPPTDIAELISEVRDRLANMGSALDDIPVFNQDEPWFVPKGKRLADLGPAISYRNSLIVYDDKPAHYTNVTTPHDGCGDLGQLLRDVAEVLDVMRTQDPANHDGRYYDTFAQQIRTNIDKLDSGDQDKVDAARVSIENLYRGYAIDAGFGEGCKVWMEVGLPAMKKAVLCMTANCDEKLASKVSPVE